MASDFLFPLAFEFSPATGTAEYLEDPSIRQLLDFFQNKGLKALKQEDRQEDWYPDWIDYQAEHRLYASVLSPERYSSLGYRFNLLRLTRFLETFAYVSPAHAYSLHVSFLGLFPILMSSNDALKKEAVSKLEQGGLFAFGVSEKEHGSDLFANEFTIKQAGASGWVADGTKYYIGNANWACMISILAKEVGAEVHSPTSQREPGVANGAVKRSPFAFFVLRPPETMAFRNVRKIRTLGIRSAYVGEFEVKGHSVPACDVISQGRHAWDAVLGTVTIGKFFLGFGAIGICEHAFAEAFSHMRLRILYGKAVTDMPHIRTATVLAFARLTAMKLYAYRALDYLQAAGENDRRYLLWCAVQKAKVSTEGVKVMEQLSECIGAKGFEADTYFESALREAQMIPSLESSMHINFGMASQFMDAYFSSSSCEVSAPKSLSLGQADPAENPYWMKGRAGSPKTVRFEHFLKAYAPLRSVANVRSFVKQAEAFGRFAAGGVSGLKTTADAGLPITMGKCFSAIAYAQLIAEHCVAIQVPPATVSVLFHTLIEDLSAEALKLSALFPARSAQRASLKGVVRVPRTTAADLMSVYEFITLRYAGTSTTDLR